MPTTGLAAVSPITDDDNLFLRLEGDAAAAGDGSLRRILTDCRVEMAMKDDYEQEDFGSLRCGYLDIATQDSAGTLLSIDSDPAYLNYVGHVTADCLDLESPLSVQPPTSSFDEVWVHWRGTMLTRF